MLQHMNMCDRAEKGMFYFFRPNLTWGQWSEDRGFFQLSFGIDSQFSVLELVSTAINLLAFFFHSYFLRKTWVSYFYNDYTVARGFVLILPKNDLHVVSTNIVLCGPWFTHLAHGVVLFNSRLLFFYSFCLSHRNILATTNTMKHFIQHFRKSQNSSLLKWPWHKILEQQWISQLSVNLFTFIGPKEQLPSAPMSCVTFTGRCFNVSAHSFTILVCLYSSIFHFVYIMMLTFDNSACTLSGMKTLADSKEIQWSIW